MTTIAKLEANRRNAVASTGPRMVRGKMVVSRNAVRHGLTAAAVVIPGECENEWVTFEAGIVESLQPVGALESELARRVAGLLWRLRRCQKYETAATAADIVEVTTDDPMTDADRFATALNERKPRGFRDVRSEHARIVTSWEKELRRARGGGAVAGPNRSSPGRRGGKGAGRPRPRPFAPSATGVSTSPTR